MKIMKIESTIFLLVLYLLLPGHVWAAETKGVVVSIKPLHSLVSGVIGDTGKAELLLTGTTSPHDFYLKPSQVKAMQKANLVFYIDDRFETFLHGAFEGLPKHVRRAAVVKKSGLTLLSHREGGAWDAHKHEAHEHKAENEHHHDEHKERTHDTNHQDADHQDAHNDNMHVWLDPENARRIVKLITKELSAIYPENRDIYKDNARSYIKKIDILDADLKSSLEGLKDRPFIVFHDAYQYFEHAYGLSGVGSITFEPDESPSPNRIKEMRNKLQLTNAKCVFREPQFSDRLVTTITEGTSAKSGTLDPLGANLADGETLYFSMMKNLAVSLKQCLK